MKKATLRIAVGIFAALIVLLTAGCQKKNIDTGANDKGKNFPPVSFKLFYPSSSVFPNGVNGMDRVLKAVEKQIHKKLNLDLDFERLPKGSDYYDTVKAAFKAGTADAFIDWRGISLANFVQEGLIKDLTDIFPEYAPKLYSKFEDSDIKAVLTNGKLYRIPNLSPDYLRLCAIVRGDIMDEYDLPDIKTLDDFEKYLKAIKEEEGSTWPVSLLIPGYSLAEAYGYTNYTPNIVLMLSKTRMAFETSISGAS